MSNSPNLETIRYRFTPPTAYEIEEIVLYHTAARWVHVHFNDTVYGTVDVWVDPEKQAETREVLKNYLTADVQVRFARF